MEGEGKGSYYTASKLGIPLIPPGFVSSKSFILQRSTGEVMPSLHSLQTNLDVQGSSICNEKFKKLLLQRPWMNCKDAHARNGDCPESLMFVRDLSPVRHLPKGVIRGCPEREDCQMVTARWHPGNSNRPVLDEAPTFYPSKEEFEDTLKYIAHIRPRAEAYGICRIIPPPTWKNPCPLKNKGIWDNSKFSTRIQEVDKLQKHDSGSDACRDSVNNRRKRHKPLRWGPYHAVANENSMDIIEPAYSNSVVRSGFESGPDFTLQSFQKYAENFEKQYFQVEGILMDLECKAVVPSIEDIESEYWRIVESPTKEIEVLYGADLDTKAFGSGFLKDCPTHSDLEYYVNSGWNLNNFPRLPGSLLSFESEDVSGILVPWLYIGMCFSSFCWHVEDHHLYSLNYLHLGSPKIWYGVPGTYALKLEAAMKKHLPDLFGEQPDLLHYLVTQFSPSILKLEGVPVYRCVQNPGEFVLTFPRAYHCGFNCGFNCAEAVNGAPLDWLPHGLNAIELYRQQRRNVSISFNKLLLGASREVVRIQWNLLFKGESSFDCSVWKDACGQNSFLFRALKEQIQLELVGRHSLCSPSQSRKMDDDFRSKNYHGCFICHYDLYLCAAACSCSPDRFSCLIHAKDLCSCPWKTKYFLFRYDKKEWSLLVNALSGKSSAVYRWGKDDLGLSLSSLATRENFKHSKPSIAFSNGQE